MRLGPMVSLVALVTACSDPSGALVASGATETPGGGETPEGGAQSSGGVPSSNGSPAPTPDGGSPEPKAQNPGGTPSKRYQVVTIGDFNALFRTTPGVTMKAPWDWPLEKRQSRFMTESLGLKDSEHAATAPDESNPRLARRRG